MVSGQKELHNQTNNKERPKKMKNIVAKFGGSSLANSTQFKKAIEIIRADSARRIIVVSAPGKRFKEDEKITDILYDWQRAARSGESYQKEKQKVCERFAEIIHGLKIDFDLDTELDIIEFMLLRHKNGTAEYAASRGEYLTALIMACALGYEFVNAVDCIRFDKHRKLLNRDKLIRKRIMNRNVVIPGFYGAVELESHEIVTFDRGGSDLTGAIIARAVRATVYENWTDVSGLYVCDPRIVDNPKNVEEVTYKALRESSYMGANVFQEEAMFPVMEGNIPTNIRNTNDPGHPGTRIYSEISSESNKITGISGRRGYTVITIEKIMMNREIGFARKILTELENLDISFEHMPGGIDTLSLIISKDSIGDKTGRLVNAIKRAVRPDKINVKSRMCIIGIVGGIAIQQPETKKKIFDALYKKYINAEMINLGSGNSLFIGVDDLYFEGTIRLLYEALVD